MITRRESPRFKSPDLAEIAAANISNHSLAVAGRSAASFDNARMIAFSNPVLTSERKLDRGGGPCINF